MALKTVPVVGVLYAGDGTPVASALVVATITRLDTDGGEVVPQQVRTTTATDGSFTLRLWPNSRGVNASQHRIQAQAAGAAPGVVLLDVLITVLDGDPSTPVALESVINWPPAPAATPTGKDRSNGYVGLTGFWINLKNAAGAVQSFLASAATAARTWTFPDKDGTVAMTSDLTKANVGLGNVDNTNDASKPVSSAQQAALDLKAPLASPALSGTPTAPTAAVGTNTTQIATMAAVKGAIDNLVNAAPGTLDTLKELADALGDDPNFATTITNSLALKTDKTVSLMDWALTQSFRLSSATRNTDGAITSASIVWPDGTTGTYTADTLSSAFPGATDAWHATYNSTPAKTITQPAVTRDASTGAVTVQPAITIV